MARLSPSPLHGIVACISVETGTDLGKGSELLHLKHGFVKAGLLPRSGVKGGRVMDCLFMHLLL
jgi:L-amino acid N-acyltransferase YncA